MEARAPSRRFIKGSTGLLTPRAGRTAVTPAARITSWWRPSRQVPAARQAVRAVSRVAQDGTMVSAPRATSRSFH
jgi:hypothetical protein